MKIKTKINLRLTQYSGQTSQSPWKFTYNEFQELIFIDNQAILFKTSQEKDGLTFKYEYPIDSVIEVKEKKIKKKLFEIYDLNFDLDNFYNNLEEDEKLSSSVNFCSGLRLFLGKNKFESVISSISSSNNSIARWTTSINKIKKLWGKEYEFSSGKFYSFPEVNVLKTKYEDCEGNLKSCGVGYRSKYIKETCEFFSSNNLENISKMKYDEAFEYLQEVPGVGPKVADCILLYGFNFKEAFPTDVWIKRIISYLYFDNKDISVKKVREFGIETFKDNAGYIQLYLFHYARKSGLMEKLKKI